MSLTDPSQARTTNLQSKTTDYIAGEEPWNKNLEGFNLPSEDTEAVRYQMNWTKWHGMYRKIPELRSTIDTFVNWVIGKKLILGDAKTKAFSKRVKGTGKDTLRQILKNILRTSLIGGDSYSWKAKDSAQRIINLKILDPGSIEIRADNFGIIKEYAQLATKGHESEIKSKEKKVIESFKPEEIFHIKNEAIADEIHGIPDPEKMLEVVKMRHQLMGDTSTIFHRYGKPTYFFEADTDDDTELKEIRDVLDDTNKNFENAVFPKGTLAKIERVSVPQYSNLDPMPYMTFLRSYFTESSNVPELVRGKSDEVSLAAGKLNLVSYKEKVRFKQIEFSEEIEKQLNLKISFEEPVMIDIEIAREQSEQEKKITAKKQAGGQLTSPNKTTNEKK